MTIIRQVKESDAQAIATIYNYYVKNSVVTFEEEPVAASEMCQRIHTAKVNNLPWLVAENDVGLVAYACAAKWKERSAYKNSVEVTVYVDHKSVRRGLGKLLYAELFKRLATENIHAIMAGIALPNQSSIVLHERFGMSKVAHFKQVGFKFGQWVDVAYWQKLLNH
jgi:L-amino acid N-acyltransferase YncA